MQQKYEHNQHQRNNGMLKAVQSQTKTKPLPIECKLFVLVSGTNRHFLMRYKNCECVEAVATYCIDLAAEGDRVEEVLIVT